MGKRNKLHGTEPQKSALQLLQLEMEKADAYRQQIIQPVNQHFIEKWDPNCVIPKAEQVRFMLSRKDGNVTLKVRVYVRFDGWRQGYNGISSMPFAWDTYPAAEELEEQIRVILPQLTQCAMAKIMEILPSDTVAELCAHLSQLGRLPARRPIEDMVQKLAKDACIKAILKAKLSAAQANYEERATQVPCPPGFQLVRIAALKVTCTYHSKRVKTALQICMDNGSISQRTTAFDALLYAYYRDPEKQREVVLPCIQKSVESLLQGLDHLPLLYTASSLQAIPGLTDPLESLLLSGTAPLGCVTIQWDGPRYRGGPLMYRPKRDKNILRYGEGKHVLSDYPEVPVNLERLEWSQVPLREITEWPQELAELCCLGAALQETLEQTFQGKGMPVPMVQLHATAYLNLAVRWRTRSIPLGPSQKSPGEVLSELVNQIYRVEAGRPGEKQRQLEVLDSLNPTELAVLRLVMEKGKTSFNAAASALADQVCTTRAYTGACLDRLTERKVPVDGDEVPLVSSQMVRNRRGGGYRMYAVCAKMDNDVLLRAAGRPYEPADAVNIKPAFQRAWFNHYLLEAEEDQRWSRFNAVLDYMPSTSLVKYVKSETGQTFLRSFTGAEAMFVRLTVEALPGCKRVAAKLWPEKAEHGEKA